MTKVTTIHTERDLEDFLNGVLDRLYAIEVKLRELDAEVEAITDAVFKPIGEENPN